MTKTVIKNGTVVTLEDKNRVLTNHSVLIEDELIVDIFHNSKDCSADLVIDATDKIIMPGFINTHMHFYSSFARGLGKATPSNNFIEVLNNLWWKLDRQLTLEDSYYSTLVACIDGIKNGTTTFLDHHASPSHITGSLSQIGKAVRECGISASLCYEVSDRDGTRVAEEGIEENIRFTEEIAGIKQLHSTMGLHASFTLSDKTLKKAVNAASISKMGFHIHCAEDKEDQTDSISKYKKRVVERLSSRGVLTNKTVLAHGTHLNDNELALIKKADSIIVHNPQSNMNNAVGIADVIKMSQSKITVGLGTDAMTTNMLEELRCGLWAQKLSQKNPSSGFKELTDCLMSNANIVNRFFDQKRGSISPNHLADIVLINYTPPTPFNEETFLGHLVFGISGSRVNTTIARGKVLMKDGNLTCIDEKKIFMKTRELSSNLWKKF